MLDYIARRLLIMVPTLVAISIITFVIIQLPPGDFLTTQIAELESQGESIDRAKIAALRAQYGLDQPYYIQYFDWATGMLQGDFGYSFEYQLPVSEVVGDRVMLTIVLNFTVILFIYAMSFPIGIYSATHQYSWGRLRADLHRILRACHAKFPAGACDAVLRQCLVRNHDRRHDGPDLH